MRGAVAERVLSSEESEEGQGGERGGEHLNCRFQERGVEYGEITWNIVDTRSKAKTSKRKNTKKIETERKRRVDN